MFFPEITKLSDSLLADEDDMVRKGLGWLLRETAKFDAQRTVPHLMKIRGHAPRLVFAHRMRDPATSSEKADSWRLSPINQLRDGPLAL